MSPLRPSRLLSAAPVAAALLFLAVVRPGVLVNAARSPVAWLAVAGLVAVGALLPRALRRAGAPAPVASWGGRLAVVGLAVLLLAPSFRQRTLVEELPGAAVSAAVSMPAPTAVSGAPTPAATGPAPAPSAPAPSAPASSAPAPSPPPATPAPAQEVRAPDRTGRLDGIGHSATGRVTLRTVDGVRYLLFEDVDIEGTVDPSVHLVADGRRTPAGGVRLGPLKAERGSFSYRLPEGVDPDRSWSVLVWCDPYDTPIAAADPR